MNKRLQVGFTIVELLILIVVIGILAALVLNSFAGSQEKARSAAAKNGVSALAKAVKRLETDTGRGLFGCPAEGNTYYVGSITSSTSGVMVAPPAGVVAGVCEWSAPAIASWRGPYISAALDPWGTSYHYDALYRTCENGNVKYTPTVLSMGANKTLNYPTDASTGACTVNTSDDIYKQL